LDLIHGFRREKGGSGGRRCQIINVLSPQVGLILGKTSAGLTHPQLNRRREKGIFELKGEGEDFWRNSPAGLIS